MRRYFSVLLVGIACFIVSTLLSGCRPDVSQYDYILNHWRGEWEGQYEITNATGEFKDLDGIREDCTTEFTLDYKSRLWMQIVIQDVTYDIFGSVSHEEGKKYGKTEFDYVTCPEIENAFVKGTKKFDAAISLDGESLGDDNLAVLQGRIGDVENGMDILMYLYRQTIETETE